MFGFLRGCLLTLGFFVLAVFVLAFASQDGLTGWVGICFGVGGLLGVWRVIQRQRRQAN
jgi:hypothetical protein